MYHNENVGLSKCSNAFAWRSAKYGFDWLCFFASIFENWRNAMEIVGQRDDAGALAAPGYSVSSEIRPVKVARFAKLAIAAITAILLIGLYVGVRYSYAIGTFTAEESRVFHIDVSEACIHGTEPAPVFEARQGDHIVLAVTSLYSGGLYLHGLETEVDIAPGMETTIKFTAEHAGRFFLHLHGNDEDHTHTELAVLEVAPR
jgi:hypothetical protein